MADIYLVSSCLIGKNCKYNGGNNLNKSLVKFLEDKNYCLACPEQLGGLSTPRISAEIVGGDGYDVLSGKARVINREGKDITGEFLEGAFITLKIAKDNQCNKAILQSRSPSCGCNRIYDGTYSNQLIDGDGVTTALLKNNNIEVIDIEMLQDFK